MEYQVEIKGHEARVEVSEHPDGGWWVSVNGASPQHVVGGALGGVDWRLKRGSRSVCFAQAIDGPLVHQSWSGVPVSANTQDVRSLLLNTRSGGDQGEVQCPMPGTVVRVLGEAGQSVDEGQVIVVVEAMKMENEFRAPFAGTIASVGVQLNQVVDSGAPLFSMEVA